ncbi:MAG TPA: MerR family transcriptional regulator [Candidatus Polarisedimenticolia bacterium]|nr:MerR family transcriptional regulator [Candidatus Polarisedimenticolia bacterium]
MTKTAPEIPNKLFYKIGEVCEITDTQPYVLRFWESEFPQLAPRKNRSGQRVYQRKDIDTVIRIKRLLYEEEYTIAGARKKLDEESPSDKVAREAEPQTPRSRAPQAAAPSAPARPEADHPVDLLVERAAPGPASAKAEPAPPGAAERLQRLEAAMAGLKDSLREVLALLKRG